MQKVFSNESQAAFAALSGDVNPVHMDVVAARRSQAGAPVVHGIHSFLWLLDCIAASQPQLPAARSLKVQFRKLIYIGDRADAELVQIGSSTMRARALVEGVEVVSVTVGFSSTPPPLTSPADHAASDAMPIPLAAIDRSLEGIAGLGGVLSFTATPAGVAAMFPHAARYLGSSRIVALACCSSLVGMVVPGLHSLFGGLELSVSEDPCDATGLYFSVTSVDERFRLVRIAVRGGGLSGRLDTFSRRPPTVQSTIAAIAPAVARNEFAGSTALIVGGSRGLGEVTAKLIAAGGGHVIVTYATGKSDADAVATNISEWGGKCDIAFYDVHRSAAPQLALLPRVPTHLYFFATPTIFRRKAGLFDVRRFNQFNTFYVTGLFELVQACLALRPSGIRVFYPSSVYVESRPAEMTEYSMSKAAGELLCADIEQYLTGVRVLARRLPPLSTDQTNSIMSAQTSDPVVTLLPIVREMHLLP